MTVITPPLYLNVDSSYGADELGLPYRDFISEGVVGSTDLAVSQRGAGANMSVDVAAGVAWIKGDDATAQPCYRCYNDGTVNLAISTANATNPRIDIVIAEVLDSTFSGASNLWRLRVVTGTAAASPSTPSTPSNAIKLAEISVPASDTTISTAQITDTRPRAYLKTGGRPAVKAYRSSGTTSPSGWSACSFNAEYFDYGGMHDNSTNPSRLTAPVDGVYMVSGAWHFQEDGSAAGERLIGIAVNGETTPSVGVSSQTYQGNSSVTRLATSGLVALTAGQYVQLYVYQGDAGALTVYAAASGWSCEFGMYWLGPAYMG